MSGEACMSTGGGYLSYGRAAHVDQSSYESYMDCFRESRWVFVPQLVSSDASAVYEAILSYLEAVASFYEAQCAYVVEVDLNLNLASNTFEWHRGEQHSALVHAEVVELDNHPLLKSLLAKEELAIYDVEALQESWPKDYGLLKDAGVVCSHAVVFPRASGIIGILIVENLERHCEFSGFMHLAALTMSMLIYRVRELRKRDSQRMEFSQLDGRDIRFNMLGCFEVETSRGRLAYGEGLSDQTCKLLVCLLRNRDSIYSIEDVFEMLWAQRLADNPYDAVKSIVYRARKQLAGIVNAPIIIASRGAFAINPELNHILDTESFLEECANVFNRANPEDVRVKSCKRAMGFYRGDMFSGIEISEHWLMTRRTRYRLTYLNMVEEYLRLLASQGRFTEMAEIVSASKGFSFVDPEVQWLLIETLIRNRRFELAKNHFFVSEDLFSEGQKRQFRELMHGR